MVRRIRRLKGKADVALLPEMFSTGFCTDRPDLAEPIDGPTMHTLQTVADQTDVAICGSFICSEKGHLYNRGFFIRPNGTPTFVDKAHLYAHGGEDRFFTAGKERTVIEYKGVRMRLLICYDLRFPVWARNKSGHDYDILLVCANWPQIRIQYWDALLAARATENLCYIAAANPVGDDGLGLHYNGRSIAYDTRLQPLAKFRDNQAGTRVASFNMNDLYHYREVLPLWKDIDSFEITK
ncbi:MAG: nitrilase family protein [Paludibacteraceae bacterium]|nr:nitrilase family protein [Paludibacteraceae bacterium]